MTEGPLTRFLLEFSSSVWPVLHWQGESTKKSSCVLLSVESLFWEKIAVMDKTLFNKWRFIHLLLLFHFQWYQIGCYFGPLNLLHKGSLSGLKNGRRRFSVRTGLNKWIEQQQPTCVFCGVWRRVNSSLIFVKSIFLSDKQGSFQKPQPVPDVRTSKHLLLLQGETGRSNRRIRHPTWGERWRLRGFLIRGVVNPHLEHWT